MEDYSKIEQLLHRMVLPSPLIGELLFDVENAVFSNDDAAHPTNQAVFVSGLARAGTTTLMRALYKSDQFGSLTYNDMPFVMAPNLWNFITSKNQKERVKTERAHGDGVEVDFDSPEALEEIFWRTYCGKEYIKKDILQTHNITSVTAKKFHAYQTLICKRYGKTRYLSKNNNHILRIKDLSVACPQSLILVPFRDPLDQAHSLLRQHRRFQDSSPFVTHYMNWLVHHEFGTTHKPFHFEKGQRIGNDTDTIDYWLERWIQAYQYILDFLNEKPGNVIPVCYEKLCQDKTYWPTICTYVNIPLDKTIDFTAPESLRTPSSTSEKLLAIARNIYQQLKSLV